MSANEVPRLHYFKCLIPFVLASVFLSPASLMAADEVVHFDDPTHKQMYQAMLKEYRCLKCQNQNLWDSNAALAGDLRREIREQIVDGKSQEDIDEYLVARYGEFVLYRPRFSSKTAVLWLAPFALLLIGLATLVLTVRNKSAQKPDTTGPAADPDVQDVYSPDKLEKARELLKD